MREYHAFMTDTAVGSSPTHTFYVEISADTGDREMSNATMQRSEVDDEDGLVHDPEFSLGALLGDTPVDELDPDDLDDEDYPDDHDEDEDEPGEDYDEDSGDDMDADLDDEDDEDPDFDDDDDIDEDDEDFFEDTDDDFDDEDLDD
jgi:hypothetical protein